MAKLKSKPEEKKEEVLSEEQLEVIRKQMSVFSTMAMEYKGQAESMRVENEKLEKTLVDGRGVVDNLNGEIKTLENTKKTLMDNIKSKEIELSNSHDMKNQVGREVEGLIKQRDELLIEVDRLDQKVKDLNSNDNDRVKELLEREANVRNAEANIKDLDEQLTAMKAAIERKEQLLALAEKAK
jgi:chromosome segregation ATPase